VDHVRLDGGHPGDAVAPGDLAARRDRALAPDTDPEHVKRVERVLPPPLGRRAAEEDLIDDDPRPGPRHRRDPLDPRRVQGAEFRPDDDLAIGGELDSIGRRPPGRGHRLDQRVHPECQPRLRQDRLQAARDP
jgi:hypothetical protein